MIGHKAVANLRAPKALIVVFREKFELHLWVKRGTDYNRIRFPIAVGKIGSRTPPGVYFVDAKTKKPDWLVPRDDDYLPEMWSRLIPFKDPSNPFAGGFLSLSDKAGVGIHSTRFDPQLGTRASHGCIRLEVTQFQRLYRLCPLGTPVTII